MALFTSRKPIFNKKMEVIAYELQYRDNTEYFKPSVNPMSKPETRMEIKDKMIDEYERVANGKKAMISFPAIALVFEMPLSFDAQSLIVSIGSDIDIDDDEIQDRLEILKERGYTLSFSYSESREIGGTLLSIAKYIAIDFKAFSPEEIQKTASVFKKHEILLIAKNLETEVDFTQAQSMGFDYFEGRFYTVARVSKNKSLDVISNTYLKLIGEWNKPTPDNKVLSEIVASDVSLSFKLLKLLNSAAFYRQTKINSVHAAIVTLGDVAFKKWLLLLMLHDMNQRKSDELVTNSILRAKFMELIWEDLKDDSHSSDSAFMVGMFSMLDIILSRDKVDILYELPVLQDVKDAIIMRQNELGKLLELAEFVERGQSEEIDLWCEAHSYTRKQITDHFYDATTWLNLLMETGTKA